VRILDRYIFREILTSSLLGTFLATFVTFLQKADKLFAVLVGSNAKPMVVAELFAWSVPQLLPLTIPFGVLVGILIGLGRLSSDGEIVAMRAAGVSSRKVIAPVLFFALLGVGLAGYASLRLTPLAARESTRILDEIAATQLSADVEPRVFDESFPNHILYIGEVKGTGGELALWKHVFIADVTPPAERASGLKDKADGPMVTVSREAIAAPDPARNRIQLSMVDSSTHEMSKDGVADDSSSLHSIQGLDASPPNQQGLHAAAMNTRELMTYYGPDWLENKIELHKRFALPLACFVLAMVGIPLGVTTRKGGKSAAYINAILLAFFCYYLSFITLINLAKQRAMPAQIALWLPNEVLGLVGLIFLSRLEMPGDRDLTTYVKDLFLRAWGAAKSVKPKAATAPADVPSERRPVSGWRLPMLPQIIDTHILSSFVFYFAVMLVSFVSLILIFNFFELMGDMVRNSNLRTMLTYLFFLTPWEIYQMTPICVLVGVLLTLGVMSKQNEITAFKACGVSLYRLAMPLLLASTILASGLFAFDYYYVPAANKIQEELHDEIKARPKASWLRPDRKWIKGVGARIYYYRYFDTHENMMEDVNVFDLDPATFSLIHEIVAARARWNPTLKTWVFEDGWSAQFQGSDCKSYAGFHGPLQPVSFPALTEAPDYFLKEATQYKEMNFLELDRYIANLTESGFGTTTLQVEFFRKFSVPAFAMIMALIAAPFGFMVGNRGAMAGIGVSIVIAISYLALGSLFKELGDVSLLPPSMAAWSPDVVFALAGLYLMMRMRS
jgi:LPS export ABC transporter permease LptF/LPS export ABC transporter permease LptG